MKEAIMLRSKLLNKYLTEKSEEAKLLYVFLLKKVKKESYENFDLHVTDQKQPPEVFCKKRCSEKFRKINRKTSVPKSLYLRPVNFGKFLRTPFLQNTSGRLLLTDAKTFWKVVKPVFGSKVKTCYLSYQKIYCYYITKSTC